VSAEVALAQLKKGNEGFVESLTRLRKRPFLKRLARRHAPIASVLSCSDSRTAPEILFGQGLGDIFVIRVAGNVATQIERASLEFSVVVLKSPLIVVMGHSGCGAVESAIEVCKGKVFPGDIQALASLISPAAKETRDGDGDWLQKATLRNVEKSISNLHASSLLSEFVDNGKLRIIGAYYALESGKVRFL
jgi:carbonic anhydrase